MGKSEQIQTEGWSKQHYPIIPFFMSLRSSLLRIDIKSNFCAHCHPQVHDRVPQINVTMKCEKSRIMSRGDIKIFTNLDARSQASVIMPQEEPGPSTCHTLASGRWDQRTGSSEELRSWWEASRSLGSDHIATAVEVFPCFSHRHNCLECSC